jgi:hypothetical protein
MRIVAVAVILAACGDNHGFESAPTPGCDAWHQWGNNASHDGASCVTGQPLHAALSSMVYDPFLDQEVADAQGDLLVHYQSPLIDGDDLYMMTKHGTYTPCNTGSNGPSCNDPDELHRLDSQVWAEQRFVISPSGALALLWGFDSDWKPEPGIPFEPMFQPALAGALLAVPGAGGALWEIDRVSGQLVRHVQPFGAAIDPDTFVAGGLAVGPDGTIYYSAIKLDHDQPLTLPAQAWLVAVAPDGTARTADYAALVPHAPAPSDACFGVYDATITPLPWPPANADGSLIKPPTAPCGAQRPGINTTPAIGSDGTVFVVSRAHNNARYAYAVAVNPDLTPRWATSLRDLLNDNCGVTIASDATDTSRTFDCRIGTPFGVERVTGLAPAAQVIDQSSSSPVALPDGGVLYGAYTGYNSARGHLFKLDRTGAVVAAFDFGWDSTPAVFGGAGDYRIVIKDNHYGTDQNGVDLGPFYITELDAQLGVIWQFASTNTQSCVGSQQAKICVSDHPNGFEWCINAPAVDRDGTVYANSEDGNTYAITNNGQQRDAIFLGRALGAAYTPVALDRQGRVFALNAGVLSVLGQ